MPRPRNSIPKYSVAKSGRAFTKVNGDFVSLGTDGPEARQKYAALLVKLQQGQTLADAQSVQSAPKPSLSVNELALAFLTHAEAEYIDASTGKPSAEVACYKTATKRLRELFGETLAADFGPVKLRAVRERFIQLKWSRGFINKSVSRIRHIWRWGIARELVPAGVLEGLRARRRVVPAEPERGRPEYLVVRDGHVLYRSSRVGSVLAFCDGFGHSVEILKARPVTRETLSNS